MRTTRLKEMHIVRYADDEFLAKMRAEGYEVVDGKNPGFRLPGWERPTRVNRLGDDYTKTTLRARMTGQRGRSASGKTAPKRTGRKVNLLIDIQAKLAAGKGAGYERWAKIFNLKEAAKTLNFLIENNLADYDELALRAEQAEDGFNAASQKIKQLEARMAGVAYPDNSTEPGQIRCGRCRLSER